MLNVPPRPWTQATLAALSRSDLVDMSRILKGKEVKGIKTALNKPELVTQLLRLDAFDLDRVFNSTTSSTPHTADSASNPIVEVSPGVSPTYHIPNDLIHLLTKTSMDEATFKIYQILDAVGSCDYTVDKQTSTSKLISEILEPAKELAATLRKAMQWQKLWPSPSTNWQLLQRSIQLVYIDSRPILVRPELKSIFDTFALEVMANEVSANEAEEMKAKIEREVVLIKNAFYVALSSWQAACPTTSSTALQFPADIRVNDRTPLRKFARSFIRDQALPMDKAKFTEEVIAMAVQQLLALEWPVEYARTASVARALLLNEWKSEYRNIHGRHPKLSADHTVEVKEDMEGEDAEEI